MGQVAVTMNGRTYRLRCGDGEEQRLLALATHVGSKVDQLSSEFGQVGEDRLLLMAALLVCDELFDARDRLAAAQAPSTHDAGTKGPQPEVGGRASRPALEPAAASEPPAAQPRPGNGSGPRLRAG